MTRSYKQPIKNEARYNVLSEAVRLLTSCRGASACVRGTYVADLKHFFVMDDPDSSQAREANRISAETLSEWTRLWESCLGTRRVEDLKVCYLAGPEPTNDLEVLVSLGVLPSNIWAFESDRKMFASAIDDLSDKSWNTPRLIKMKAESFFASIPVVFDVVYLDCCASLISSSHALRLVSDLFRYQRLQSPGVLITNFCEPELADEAIKAQYADLLAQRAFVSCISSSASFDTALSRATEAYQQRQVLESDLDEILSEYSDFITQLVISTATTVVPAIRLANTKIKNVYALDAGKATSNLFSDEFLRNCARESSFCLLSAEKWLPESAEDRAKPLREKLARELSGACAPSVNTLGSLELLWYTRNARAMPNEASIDSVGSLESAFQFHDKPGINLGVDLALCQLTRPMFPALHSAKRYSYRAKEKRMYLDIIPFDECRYIFDWIPLPPHMKEALNDAERQYVFRFALDGLVKQRLDYSTDYFFSGSVIDGDARGFEKAVFPNRVEVE